MSTSGTPSPFIDLLILVPQACIRGSHYSHDLQRPWQPYGLLSHWVVRMRSGNFDSDPEGVATMSCHFPVLQNSTIQKCHASLYFPSLLPFPLSISDL